jgi:hypothetical protein
MLRAVAGEAILLKQWLNIGGKIDLPAGGRGQLFGSFLSRGFDDDSDGANRCRTKKNWLRTAHGASR